MLLQPCPARAPALHPPKQQVITEPNAGGKEASPRSHRHCRSGNGGVPVIPAWIPRRGRRSPGNTPGPAQCRRQRCPKAGPSLGPQPSAAPGRWRPAGMGAGGGVRGSPRHQGKGASRFRLGRGYLPRQEARMPGGRGHTGPRTGAPAAAAAASPRCAQQPLPRARARRPPAAPPGAHRPARCLRPAERLRPAAGTPRGALATRTGSLRAADASSVPAVRVGAGRRHVVRQLVAVSLGRRQRAFSRG